MSNQNPLVLALHGAGMHAGIWGGLVPHLLGYRLHALNLPGHTGTSTADDLLPRIEMMADFVKSEIDDMKQEQYVLMGHSMGSCVALVAANHPKVKAVVLLGAGITMPVHPALLEKAIATPDEAKGMILKWGTDPAHPHLKLVQEMILNIMNEVNDFALGIDLAACNQFDGTDYCAHLKKPTLVITGDQDRMTPPEKGIALANAIEGAVFEYVENAGHMLSIEEPAGTSLKIKTFLESIEMDGTH